MPSFWQNPGAWFSQAGKNITSWADKTGQDIAGIHPADTDAMYQSLLATMPKAPSPDVSDAAVHVAAEAQARQVLAQRGRRSTFLLGGVGADASMPGAKSLLGG